MKNLRNKNAPPTADLVQYYIDSAYDKVVAVYNALSDVTALADALAAGTFENLVYIADIDTLAELNAIVADATLVDSPLVAGDINSIFKLSAVVGENVASEAYVLTQVTGLFDYKGAYNANTNTPDLDTAPSGISQGDVYVVSVAGTFFATALEVGDLIIANQNDPTTVTHWDIVNRNIDSSAFATAAQGALADTAVQSGDNVSVLTNDAGYEANPDVISQVEAEAGIATTERIFTAERVKQAILALETGEPNAALASQAEAEAGVENTKTMTAFRVAQAIAVLGGGASPLTTKGDLWGFSTVDARVAVGTNGQVLTADSAEAVGVKWADTAGGGMTAVYTAADYTAAANEVVYVASDIGQWDITLPASPNSGDKVSVWDCGDNASANIINILRNGSTINGVAADFAIDINGGRFDGMYNGTTWKYSYVVQTTQPIPAAVHEEIAGTSYTIQAEDSGKILYTTNAGAIAITLPDGLPIGHHFSIQQVGTGVPTVTRSGTDTVNGVGTGISPSAQWTIAYFNKFAVGQWAGTN